MDWRITADHMNEVVSAVAARTQPALVHHGAEGRLELTGSVLGNWIAKSYGLVEDLDIGSDVPIIFVMRPGSSLHWRAGAMAMAAGLSGADVHVLFVTDDPAEIPIGLRFTTWVAFVPEELAEHPVLATARDVVVYAQAPLALAAQAPTGTIDYNTEIRSFPDAANLPATSRMHLFLHTPDRVSIVPRKDTEGDPAGEVVLLGGVPSTSRELATMFASLRTGLLVICDSTDTENRLFENSPEGRVRERIGAWTK